MSGRARIFYHLKVFLKSVPTIIFWFLQNIVAWHLQNSSYLVSFLVNKVYHHYFNIYNFLLVLCNFSSCLVLLKTFIYFPSRPNLCLYMASSTLFCNLVRICSLVFVQSNHVIVELLIKTLLCYMFNSIWRTIYCHKVNDTYLITENYSCVAVKQARDQIKSNWQRRPSQVFEEVGSYNLYYFEVKVLPIIF